MSDNLQWAHFFDHTGGLNTRNTGTTTPIFDATQMLNIDGIVKGGFRKSSGYSRYAQAPLLASGTYMRGTVLPSAESDPWTGAGDATTASFSSGIMTNDESAGATGFQKWHNLEAGFATTAAAETRVKVRDAGTLSGVYAYSIMALDNGTKHFELVALQTSGGTKQIGVLTTTADRTVIGSYTSPTDFDWSDGFHRYAASFDSTGNIVIYVDDLVTAFITIAYTSLPASTETARVTFGSYETATVGIQDTDYFVYKIGATTLDTSPVTGIYSFIDETNTQEVIITYGAVTASYSSTTADWSTITGGTAITSGAKPHFVTFNDTTAANAAIVIMTTESRDVVQKYGGGGTKANLGGSPPAGKFVEIYHERCFIANTAAEPSGVFFSAFGDPEDRDSGSGTWDTTNDVFLVDRHRFGQVTGLMSVNDLLLIFAERGLYRLQGWGKGSFLLEIISTRNGCVAPNSLVRGPLGSNRNEGVYFRDKDGYYWTDGQIGSVIRVSEKILTTIDEEFNHSQVNNEAAFLDKRRSLVGWATTQGADTTNSLVYSLDYIQAGRGQQGEQFLAEGWFPHSLPMRAAGVVRESASKDVVLFSDHAGLVHTLNNGADSYDGADFEGNRSTAWLMMGSPHHDKIFRYVRLYLKAVGDHELTLSWASNFQDDFSNTHMISLAGASDLLGTTFVLGSSLLGTTGLIYESTILDIRGNALRLNFKTSLKDEPFTVLGFSVGFEELDWFESNV